MIKKLRIGKLKITFVFRHKWEKNDIMNRMDFNRKELGLFYQKYRAVGSKKKGMAMFDKDNHVNKYILGVNLIWAKFWFDVGSGVLELNVDK